jgi:mannitol-1-phosphate 5-dehydrogenase
MARRVLSRKLRRRRIMKMVQFGAGNIGRSFIGQLFSRAGWEVVFVDVEPRIVSLLNEARYYTVVIKREGKPDEHRRIGPVRAVDGRDAALVGGELAAADMTATSVGKGALPKILPVIAKGLQERFRLTPEKPLDIIIAENVRGAAEIFRSALASELGSAYPLDRLAGLVETSIGKMVPIMRSEDLVRDPLQVFAEEYETLIVDKRGFRGPLPGIAGIFPVDTIAAYVDRKLFIHNLGHAAAAYLGYRAAPEKPALADVLALPEIEEGVRRAMGEAADALVLEYPGVYSREDLAKHIDDLLTRFKNRALGDTVHRVGRDLPRKLSRDDRLIGAMLLCAGKGLPFGGIAEAAGAAFQFAAPDEDGALYPGDARFRQEYFPSGVSPRGIETALREVCGLDKDRDKAVYETLAHPGPV